MSLDLECMPPVGSPDIVLMERGSWWATVRWKIAGSCIGPRTQMRFESFVAVFAVFGSLR